MGQRAPNNDAVEWAPPRIGPSLAAACGASAIVFLVLMSNGRAIGAADTRPTERVAASLVQEGNLDLDEFTDLELPFVRRVGRHVVSIYPILSALLAAPLFAGARFLFALDETGLAFAGKTAAALFSSIAAGVLFLAVGRRSSPSDGLRAALVFALGTSIWSTSQALWQHPAAVLCLSTAVLFVVKAEDDPVWAGRAGLPLSLAVAARQADVVLVGVLALGLSARWPRRFPALIAWGLPGAAMVFAYQWFYFGSPLRQGFAFGPRRFSEPWGVGHAGLLISPAKGLLVFTPVVLVTAIGLVRAFRRNERSLAVILGAAVLAHFVFLGRWTEWHGGESWGPRMMTDVLPLLFVFFPDGFAWRPALGTALAALSIGIQALGAWSYDYRWERLYQRPPDPGRPELWRIADSPIPFYAQPRVVILALPGLRDGHLLIREHRMVLLGETGSRVQFDGQRLRILGADPTLGDVHLLGGARLDEDKLRLKKRWDGLFLRVRSGARHRHLELRIRGQGHGTLYVGERSFWVDAPRWSTYPMDGSLRVNHPFFYPESGGGDLIVTLGRSPGEVALDSLALVAPGEPETAWLSAAYFLTRAGQSSTSLSIGGPPATGMLNRKRWPSAVTP